MTWAQIATLIVSIAGAVVAGTGVIVLSINGIHSQVATLRGEAVADRHAWQRTMDNHRKVADTNRRDWQRTMDNHRKVADTNRRDWQRTMDEFRVKAETDRLAFVEAVHEIGERQAHIEGSFETITETANAAQPTSKGLLHGQ